MKSIVTIKRPKIDYNRLFCVVVRTSKTLVLCAYINDFVIDGYLVMARKWIADTKPSKSDAYYSEIMVKEGLLPLKGKDIPDINVNSWKEALKSLPNQVIAVENESAGDYWFGPIVRCDEKAAVIRHYDGCGKNMGEKSIRYDQITRVSIGDRYINTFRKYLK